MDSKESDLVVNTTVDNRNNTDEIGENFDQSFSLDPKMRNDRAMSYLENSENSLRLEGVEASTEAPAEVDDRGQETNERDEEEMKELNPDLSQEPIQEHNPETVPKEHSKYQQPAISYDLPEPQMKSSETLSSNILTPTPKPTNSITQSIPEPLPEGADLPNLPENSPFTYNHHFEAIFDHADYFPSLKSVENVVKFDHENGQLINHANIKALIVQLTSPEIIDYNLIYDFFITYRMFTNSETVMNYLLVRLIWSLQYLNKSDQESQKIGQLVLLRTFVVLRHWILNYFVDDFNSNLTLCDTFIKFLNQIILESGLIKDHQVFEIKILKDLKTHWLSSLKEFWNVELEVVDVFKFPLPLTNELTLKTLKKSSTEMSLHTNPSYRRSAMLSLYDQKAHHKCLVFDESKFKTENPQLSINNLLVQHKSSRQSIMTKLNNFASKKTASGRNSVSGGSGRNSVSAGTATVSAPLSPSKATNRMNLNDSSVGLKRTHIVDNNQENDKISLNPIHIDNIGFSTNGNIKLPTPKVSSIVPLTPVKKMEYTIRTQPNYAVEDWADPINSKLITNVDFSRKKSIKKILDSWKKGSGTKHSNQSNEELNDMINQSISEDIIGDRVDILSARIIDELEFLIRNYIQADSNHTIIEGDTIENSTNDHIDIDDFDNSIDLSGSPAKKYTMSRNDTDDVNDNDNNGNRDSARDVDINDLSELNMNKIDNIINDQDERDDIHEFSFQRPTSINWNDVTGLELEHSRKEEDIELPEEIEESDFKEIDFKEELPEPDLPRDPSNASFGVENLGSQRQSIEPLSRRSFSESLDRAPLSQERSFGLAEPPFTFNNNGSRYSTVSTPSNFTDYDAEIEDLGIAVSPKSKNQQMKRISFNTKRFSRSSSNSLFKRDSIKSYVSYDSAFSISRESIGDNGNLRKKAGVNNLRTLAGLPSERKSLDTSRVSASSVRKSMRTSTILALSELPFNGHYDSRSSLKLYRNSAVGDSSIFSVAMKSRNSIANSFQTLNENADITNDSDEFAFGFRAPSEDNDSLRQSIAIPGISNHVLKELAAIPDESFHFNPIDYALDKLEGAKKQKEHQIFNDELNTSETTHVDDTNDILDEINNANTEDIIETSSQNYTQEGPLSPIERDVSGERPLTPLGQMEDDMNTSTPTHINTIGTNQTDDNIDNVFIFSANYSNGTDNQKFQSRSGTPVYQSPRLILQSYHLNNWLGIENTIENDNHISFVLSYSSVELSDHFTMIERDILQEIDWKDLIELKWNKELTPVNSWLEIIVNDDYFNMNRGVNLVIARFNLMVNWIISEILLTKNVQERVQIISRFIHIGHNCLLSQNYSTLMQILLALTSEKINKLKHTWKELPPGDILVLKNLEELASPIKNFINLRVSINKIQPSKGCVPFVGLYLSDLIFNTERPKVINKSKGVINFARFRTSVHIVKSLSQCIEWSSYYKLNINNELLSKCLYIRSLDEDEMNFCLGNIIDP